MGFQKDPGPRKRRRDRTLALDESGQLSIDFMIGLSIFLITLIIAATMISGLLVGLQSRTIDYDAVAYRTGVILVEDPGEPNTLFNYKTIEADDQWELIPIDRIDLISRFGLTLYKSTPRVLSQEKVGNFFELNRYSPSEIRERIIFGSYPYRFNVTIKEIGGAIYPPVGNQYSDEIAYGYIRRVVLINKPSSAVVDMGTHGYYNSVSTGQTTFRVELDYQTLMNLDRDPDYMAPQYWIEPPKEDIAINLTNVPSIKNTSAINAKLNSIRIGYIGQLSDGTVVTGELPIDVDANINGEIDAHTFSWPGKNPRDVTSSVNITFPAGYFIPSSSYADVAFTTMVVVYEFDPTTVNLSPHSTYSYLPGNLPQLEPAVMEVRVW